MQLKAFDLFAIPAFTKQLAKQGVDVVNALELANAAHKVERVVIIQHTDFHNDGKSTRFTSRDKEDVAQKKWLLSAKKTITALFPGIEVRLFYARVNIGEMEIVEVFDIMAERVRLVADYDLTGQNIYKTLLWLCIDFRFRKETRSLVRFSLKEELFVLFSKPGSTKDVGGCELKKSSEEIENEVADESMAAEKALSIAVKYGCEKIILVHHADCGAYGGRTQFGDDEIAEELMHREALEAMKKKIEIDYKGIEVVKIYARLIADQTQIQFVLIP